MNKIICKILDNKSELEQKRFTEINCKCVPNNSEKSHKNIKHCENQNINSNIAVKGN